MEEKYLPIGSVVMLKEAKKAVMIIGYLPIPNEDQTKIYDYSASLYPEGLISSNQNLVFNKEDIDKILFKGYVDDSEKELVGKMDELKAQVISKMNENK